MEPSHPYQSFDTPGETSQHLRSPAHPNVIVVTEGVEEVQHYRLHHPQGDQAPPPVEGGMTPPAERPPRPDDRMLLGAILEEALGLADMKLVPASDGPGQVEGNCPACATRLAIVWPIDALQEAGDAYRAVRVALDRLRRAHENLSRSSLLTTAEEVQ